MAKLHELLAAEKTRTAAWQQLIEETLKKLKNTQTYFDGHSKSLRMIGENDANAAVEAAAREEKPVTTTVYDTLEYALDIFGKSEDLQFQKNTTNQKAVGTVMWKGEPLFKDLPVDELMGLEARLTKIRGVFEAVPTLDASKHWKQVPDIGKHVWEVQHPEETTKTEKQTIPVVLHEATKEHPAQVQAVAKDVVVGRFKTIKRSGAATALQKANAIKLIDELLVEVKAACRRANDAAVEKRSIASQLVPLLLEPFGVSTETHQ